MFDDAAMVLEEIAPEDKTRNEVLGARVAIYMAAKKWNMAAAVASHLVKVDPETAGWCISLAYSVRRIEGAEKAEATLLRTQSIHPKVAMIAFSLACYASVNGPYGGGAYGGLPSEALEAAHKILPGGQGVRQANRAVPYLELPDR